MTCDRDIGVRRSQVVDASADGGFTLTELLVTITIMAVVSTAIIASVVAIQRNLGVADATLNDMSANRIAVERVGSLLRGAVGIDGRLSDQIAAVTAGSPTTVTFYSVTGRSTAQNPVQVRLTRQANGDLTEEIFPPSPDLVASLTPGTSPTYPATAPARVIARDIQNSDIFQYWSHQQVGADVSTRCGRVIPADSGLAAGELPAVDSVRYRLVLQAPTGYESAPSDLQGWARFASSIDVGYSSNFTSAGCLDDTDSGFRYDDAYVTP